MPPNGVIVAFYGDQGVGVTPSAVLQLTKQENAEILFLLGDFEYGAGPVEWEKQFNSILGPEYPIIGSVGNHDVVSLSSWVQLSQLLVARLVRTNMSKTCFGQNGVNMVCSYKGLSFYSSGNIYIFLYLPMGPWCIFVQFSFQSSNAFFKSFSDLKIIFAFRNWHTRRGSS